VKENTKPWMEFARQDLSAAEKLQSDESLSNVAMFHCQQCVEKSLKALYEESERHIPRIHSTLKLYADILKLVPGINQFATNEDLTYIDAVYIDTRYPGGFGLLPNGTPSRDDVIRGVEIARKVFIGVCTVLQ